MKKRIGTGLRGRLYFEVIVKKIQMLADGKSENCLENWVMGSSLKSSCEEKMVTQMDGMKGGN